MNSNKVTFAAIAAIGVALAFAVVPALTSAAYAVPPGLREACENPAEKEPKGQQDKCTAPPLDDVVKNKAGHKPPGHNKD